MDFYSRLFADGLSGGGDELFKLAVSGNLTVLTAEMFDSNGITKIGNYAFERLNLTSVTISNNVTSIGAFAFGSCENLTSVTIPNSVTSIGNSAFSYSGLTSVEIPGSVTSISNNAFGRCNKLKNVTIGEGVKTIGADAFCICALTSITIPSSVTSIGDSAFNSCNKLASVTMLRTTPPTLGGNGVFTSTSSALVIYVPAESVDAYKAKSRWSNYASKIQAIPS